MPPPEPVTPPAPEPVAEPVEPAVPEPPAPVKDAVAKKPLVVKGPAQIAWYDRGTLLGKGSRTLSIPASAKAVVAVDLDRGVRTVIPLKGGAVDYDALPKGKLSVRANPFAEVKLGRASLGTTPFPPVDVVAGTYVVKLTKEKRVETRTVQVKAGETLKVAVDFTK